MSETHRHFHDELARLKERVLHMSSRAEDSVRRAVESFLSRDDEAGRDVMNGDWEIDALEVEVDDRVTGLLALHQPVAKDLRLILAALKISNDLERVGDHAVNIAQSARTYSGLSQMDPEPELIEMAQCAREMLGSALTAFVKNDADLGREVCKRDDRVDALNRSIFQRWSTRMAAEPHVINTAMELMRVSRNLERVADLATNIAEDVVFLVEGTSIKHHAEDPSESPATPTQ
jgi:phosphate transport system protein